MTEAPERFDWVWYGVDADGNSHVSFGRWKKHPCQFRYKFAEPQPTEHDHRADLVGPSAIREAALREAAEICTGIIRDYDVMKPDGKTYEPLKVQKAAKGMVSLARQDILALIQVSASQNDKKEG